MHCPRDESFDEPGPFSCAMLGPALRDKHAFDMTDGYIFEPITIVITASPPGRLDPAIGTIAAEQCRPIFDFSPESFSC
jgi:hypothetical protein